MNSESSLPTGSPSPSPRDLALDGVRTVAILLMVACHCARLILREHRPDFFAHAMLIEPFCQALFMAMVGFGMVYSFHRFSRKQTSEAGQADIAGGFSLRPWLGGQLKRAVLIYLIGGLIFCFELGWQFPWIFTNQGILGCIFYAILFFLPLFVLVARRPGLSTCVAAGLTLALALAYTWLVSAELAIFPLNAGKGAVMPNIILTGFGIFAGLVIVYQPPKAAWALLAFCGLLVVASLMVTPFETLFSRPAGRISHTTTYQLAGSGPEQIYRVITGGKLHEAVHSHYRWRPILVPMLIGMTGLLYGCFRLLGPILNRASGLLIIGRHSLGVYIFHLALLAIPVVIAGKQRVFTQGLGVFVTFGLIVLACYGFAFFREKPSA